MIGSLSRRERGLVVGCVVVLVLVAIWEFGIQPIRESNSMAAELVPIRERLLVKRQEIIGTRAAVTRELEQVNAGVEKLSTRFLAAAAPPVAASELQRIAKDTATASGMEVRSERILPPVERGEMLEIPVEIAVSGEIRNLVQLLTQLDAAPKLVIVQDVKIRVMNVAQPKDLLATVTLSGLIMPAKTKT
jgi:Tfp pilus assembly protein PilO